MIIFEVLYNTQNNFIMKKSSTFLIFFILFFSYVAYSQCPATVDTGTGNGGRSCAQITMPVGVTPPGSFSIGGTPYTQVGTSLTYLASGGNCNNVTYTPFLGTLTIGGTTCTYSGGILPLNFIKYSARSTESALEIHWSTVEEKDIASFKAEISEDATNWHSYDLNSTILSSRSNQNNYSETLQPAITPNYIRIVAVDIDGSETKTRIFSPDKTTKSGFDVYPNPSSLNHIDFSCFDCSPKGSTLEIYTTEGKKVLSMNEVLSGDPVDISSLSKGVYFIKIQDSKVNTQTTKFVRN